ncbi:MAG: hydantoinase B/oxoprolinase family protein [Caldimonas sp.]
MTALHGRARTSLTMAALVAALLASIVAGVAFGAVPIPPRDVVAAIGRGLTGSSAGLLPRAVRGVLAARRVGGAGEHRGGFGVNYRIRLRRGDARVSMVMDHGRTGPPGAEGGGAGGTNKVSVIRDGVAYVPPHLSKDQDIAIRAGDVIAVSTPGGGGFGPASARPRAAVERDLALGYYSAAEAALAFGPAEP